MGSKQGFSRRLRAIRAIVAGTAALCLCATVAVAEDTWSAFKFSTGVDYSSGDYGTGSDTDILYVPFAVKYEHGPWLVGLTVPYIRIKSDGRIVGGADGTVISKGNGSAATTTNSGLGDIVAQAGYGLLRNDSVLPAIDLIGKIKFPTADKNKGLGTGEFDYSIQADISKTFGRLTPFGTIGYRFIGDPDGIDLNNIVFASIGAGYKLHEAWNAGAILDYRQSTSDRTDDPLEVMPYVVWKAHRDWALTGYSVFGLSEGSADYGGGLQVRYTWEK